MSDTTSNAHDGLDSDRYPLSLSPLKIGPVEVRNRIFMGPHGLRNHFVNSPTGEFIPTMNCLAYYEERAAGGVGLIIHSFAVGNGAMAGPTSAAGVPAYAAVADAVHRHGAKIFAQMWLPEDAGVWDALSPMRPVRGPSNMPHFGRPDVGRAVAEECVSNLVGPLGVVARHLATAGYDGIEIHAAHGHLIEQFLSAHYNQRTDRYGGDIDKRLTFLFEVIDTVRRNFGHAGAVGMRFNPDEMLAGGFGEDEAKTMLTKILDRELLDFVNLGTGTSPRTSSIKTHFVEPMHERGLVERVGTVVRGRVPLLANPCRVTSLETAEDLLAENVCDSVGMVRGLIAEPRLVENARVGHPERNRICVAGNACSASTGIGAWFCELNPAVGREASWGELKPLPKVQRAKVVIVGAGPAGLEAARVAAAIGHEVVVIERSDVIGGQLVGWAALPGREHRRNTIEWYQGRLEELGVKLRTGVQATVELILAEAPDAVIVATGGSYDRLGRSGVAPAPLAGWDRPFVLTPEDVIAGARPTGIVMVIDEEGLHTGPGIAELLARAGAKVEIATTAVQVARSLVSSAEAEPIHARLVTAGVTVTTRAEITEIGDGFVEISKDGRVEHRAVDAVVLANSRVAGPALDRELAGRVAQVYAIGDALAPRSLAAAMYEGQRFARLIGLSDAASTTDNALLMPGDPSMAARPAA